jgi:PEP-CTERM motif
MRICVVLAAVLFLTCTAQAGSAVVAFSYTFQDKKTVTGTVEGDLQPDNDLVTGLRNMNAVYSGQPNTPLIFVAPPGVNLDLSLSGTQLFVLFGWATDPSIDGLHFGFELSNIPNTIGAVTVGTFITSFSPNDGLVIEPPRGSAALEADFFRSGSYSASTSASIVPEPSSIALAGTGLGLLLVYNAYRRVLRKAAAR